MQPWPIVKPTEANNYCLFEQSLETDKNTFFHITKKENLESILKDNFKTAKELGIGTLDSLSFGKNSATCIANFHNEFPEDMVVIAVFFDDAQLKHVYDEAAEIKVHKKEIVPEILGYCDIPAGYSVT